MTEEEKLKDHIKKRCGQIVALCDGACMCSSSEKPLYEFSRNIQSEMRILCSEVHNFAFIYED